MNVENIFRRIPALKNVTLDTVLFESKYPVMFTCRNENDIYLFICCLVNGSIIKWIGTKTNYEILIELLENKITIRNAFLSVSEDKLMIKYDGQNVICNIVESRNIQSILLSTAGEYMDAEDDEYTEEIAVFRQRNLNTEYRIKPQINSFLAL